MSRLKIGAKAPGGTALGLNSEEITLEEQWTQGPIFLTFLRHFG